MLSAGEGYSDGSSDSEFDAIPNVYEPGVV